MFDSLDAFLEVWSNYFYDKGYFHHFAAGMLLAFMFFAIFRRPPADQKRKAIVWIALCVLLPIVGEVTQCFMPERTCDPFDALSSILGSGLIYYLAQRRKGYVMKRDYRFSLVLALVFLIPCFSYAGDPKKEPNGFMEIRFGQTKADFFSEYGPESEWKKGDNPFKNVGVDTIEAELNNTSVAVDFYQDRLFSVCAGFTNLSPEESKTVFANLIDKYGVPDRFHTESDDPAASWSWEKSSVYFTYFPKKHAAFVVVSDREVIKVVITKSKEKKQEPKAAPKGSKSSL